MKPVQLFYVRSQIADLHGYKNVPVTWFVAERARPLFGPDGWLGIPYERVITGYIPDPDGGQYGCESAVEECFTDEEAKAFVEFIRTHRNDASASIDPVELPIGSNTMGISDQPVGGDTDFLTIGDSPDYDLPFKVWGLLYYGGCTFNEASPDARRQQQGSFFIPTATLSPGCWRNPPGRIEPCNA